MFTLHELIVSLREGPFTSLGSYPKFWVTTDGTVLSFEAVTEELGQVARSTRDRAKDGWAIEGVGVNWEDPELYCDVTGARIPSAYAENEAQED
ncbi:MAG: hypothetical protein WC565_08035 [Parcubacteria group bacterium]